MFKLSGIETYKKYRGSVWGLFFVVGRFRDADTLQFLLKSKRASNQRLKRTNIRCHLLCKETHKSRHQTFARLAGRYMCKISRNLICKRALFLIRVCRYLSPRCRSVQGSM